MLYNRYGDNMKRPIVPSLVLIFLGIILFVIFTNANNTITSEEALLIGEEKYLKFLWMVDGAFNSDRYKEDFVVNGKNLKDKVFTCKYINSKECVGNNFESEFEKLFSKEINYQDVYSDKAIYSWITYDNGKYIFNNLTTCDINRMNVIQNIKVSKINNDKIVYEVSFNEKERVNKREFVLMFEDNEWKISNAFYHDLCSMKYFIR